MYESCATGGGSLGLSSLGVMGAAGEEIDEDLNELNNLLGVDSNDNRVGDNDDGEEPCFEIFYK